MNRKQMQYRSYYIWDDQGQSNKGFGYFCSNSCYLDWCEESGAGIGDREKDPYRIVGPCMNCRANES